MATLKSVDVGVRYYTSQYAGCVGGGKGQSSKLPDGNGTVFDKKKNYYQEQGYLVIDNEAFSKKSTACDLASVRFRARHSNNGNATLDTVVGCIFSVFTKSSVSGNQAAGSGRDFGSKGDTSISQSFASSAFENGVSQGHTSNIDVTMNTNNATVGNLFGNSTVHPAYHLYARYTNGTTIIGTTRLDYLESVTVTLSYYSRCYVRFQGDSVTAKTITCDSGTIPSFGSTPTREGYVFKGWSNGSTTYTGALPTAGETDVTYTAVWEKVPQLEIIAINMTYGSQPVSRLNKVPNGESFLLSVQLKTG